MGEMHTQEIGAAIAMLLPMAIYLTTKRHAWMEKSNMDDKIQSHMHFTHLFML